MARHVLSIADLGAENLSRLVKKSLSMAATRPNGSNPLRDKIVGTYFRVPSTRTRSSFTVGALKLGAKTVSYGPNDLQITTGETIQDTTRVLSGYLDALVIRTNQSVAEMKALASQDRMAVINAMSDNEHPTQAIADLTTISEAFGRLDDVHVLYIGEGNNTASALSLAVAQTRGMRLTVVTPPGYGLSREFLDEAKKIARSNGADIEQHHSPDDLQRGVNVVYTTRWQTMGVERTAANWRQEFAQYAVTPELMKRVSRPSGTIFMHDLPAVRGDEVSDEVLDGPQSVAFRQAEHKMHSAMAILLWCFGCEEERGSQTKHQSK